MIRRKRRKSEVTVVVNDKPGINRLLLLFLSLVLILLLLRGSKEMNDMMPKDIPCSRVGCGGTIVVPVLM
jgi:hypothetical protein